jgi:hypothetical protein
MCVSRVHSRDLQCCFWNAPNRPGCNAECQYTRANNQNIPLHVRLLFALVMHKGCQEPVVQFYADLVLSKGGDSCALSSTATRQLSPIE